MANFDVGRDADVAALVKLAPEWEAYIERVKVQVVPRDFDWYPYDTVGNLEHFDRLLTGSHRRLLELIGNRPLLDLGCGDGQLSLLFEALKCKVVSVDYGPTNYNEMKGIRSLKRQLSSSIEIRTIDFDSQFSLDGIEGGMAFLLGVLYHLKNPVYVLETLSKHAKYCILSTKIASVLPDHRTSIAEWPVGYLLGADELNRDDTNFWIFSETGFKRLLSRTNWTILDYWKPSGTEDSSPDSINADQRVFCLAQSTYGVRDVTLLNGWYAPEIKGSRWTGRVFSIEIPKGTKVLQMDLYIPEACLAAGSLQMVAKSGSARLFSDEFDRPGSHRILHRVEGTTIDFELNRALAPDNQDVRERGIIVSSIVL